MEPIDLLISARWIIPIDPANRVLEHHALAVKDGRIVSLLPTKEALARYAATEHIDRPSHVLLPGFVNAHAHTGMTLLRGTAENMTFEAWLKQRIWPFEAQWLSAEFVRDSVELAVAGMIASGTTCFAEQYFYPEVVAQSASNAQLRVCVGAPIIDRPTAWASSADECLNKAFALRDEYRADPLVTTALAPHAPYSLGDAAFDRIRRAVDEIEMPVSMHLHESPAELAGASSDERPLARIDRLGLLNPLFSGVHMTQLNAADIEVVIRTGMNVVHCPQSNLKLGNGICPVPLLVKQGVNVALGTDGAASNNDLDMLDELRTAALLAGPTLTAHDWLQVATLNGARTLGLAESIGSLDAGKWADLCCIDLEDEHCQPVYDPAAAIIYSATRANISDVWVAGRCLYVAGEFTRLDRAAILHRTTYWQQRIASR